MSRERNAEFGVFRGSINLYGQLFLTFTKIGAFTIGGGYAMLPLIEKEVVERKKWVEAKEFLDMVALSQSLPGIFTVNLSILTGYKLKKTLGGVAATLGTILPSFLIILLIAAFFRHFNENIYVVKAFKAIRPTVVALIAVPVFKAAKEAGVNLKTVIIPIATAFLIWHFGVSPIYVVIAAAVGGICFMKFRDRNVLAKPLGARPSSPQILKKCGQDARAPGKTEGFTRTSRRKK